MVDALQSNFGLIVDLHENHGVPIDFVYKGIPRSSFFFSTFDSPIEVPFLSEACSVGALQVVKCIHGPSIVLHLFYLLSKIF